MTEQEFLALEPREQDAVVAEKVMGLEWMRGEESWECGLLPDGYILKEHSWQVPGEDTVVGDPVPGYTTDISAAWEVVEKMNENGRWFYAMENRHAEIVGGPYWCEFATKAFEEGAQAYAPTAPLAICIAALKAVGEIR